jgi:hypothetical protein
MQAESRSKLEFRPSQGGYNKGGVGPSAGTHDGGAVVDLKVDLWSHNQRMLAVKWLRRCGWAAWLRAPYQGPWPWHIHAVRIEDASASWAAKQQVTAYRKGRNGLANNAADDGPKVPYTTWEDSEYNPVNRKPGWVDMVVVRGPLIGVDGFRQQKHVRAVGFKLRGIRVKKWGRWNLKTKWATYYAIKAPSGTPRYLDYVKKG